MVDSWFERIVFSPASHEALPLPREWFGGHRPTLNGKDLAVTAALLLLAYVCTRHVMLAVCGTAALIFEPAVLLFPYNLVVSLWCARAPTVWRPEAVLPEIQTLLDEKVFSRVQGELEALGPAAPAIDDVLPAQSDIGSPRWRLLPLRTLGCTHERVMERAPTLAAFLAPLGQVTTVFFSRLQAGGAIPPHTGYCKGILRIHVGVRVPEPDKVRLTLRNSLGEEEVVQWREKGAVAFDDMFLHSVAHRGAVPRDVLWLDVVRPEVRASPALAWFTAHLMRWIARSSWMQAVERRVERVRFDR